MSAGTSTATAWQATNVAPMQGLNCRASADPAAPVVARLDPLLQVRVTERAGAWAHIVCSNGWAAWVDDRRLLSLQDGALQLQQALAALKQSGHQGSASARRPTKLWLGPVALLGGALAITGTFLPWLTLGDVSVKAWDVSAQALYFGSESTGGIKAGIPILIAALVVWPLLLRRSMPVVLCLAVAAVVLAAAGAAMLQGHRTDPSLSPGIGLFATAFGGVLIAVDHIVAQRFASAPGAA